MADVLAEAVIDLSPESEASKTATSYITESSDVEGAIFVHNKNDIENGVYIDNDSVDIVKGSNRAATFSSEEIQLGVANENAVIGMCKNMIQLKSKTGNVDIISSGAQWTDDMLFAGGNIPGVEFTFDSETLNSKGRELFASRTSTFRYSFTYASGVWSLEVKDIVLETEEVLYSETNVQMDLWGVTITETEMGYVIFAYIGIDHYEYGNEIKIINNAESYNEYRAISIENGDINEDVDPAYSKVSCINTMNSGASKTSVEIMAVNGGNIAALLLEDDNVEISGDTTVNGDISTSGKIAAGGNISTSGTISTGNGQIGKIINDTNVNADVALAAGTAKRVESITLTKGTWIVRGRILFPAGTSGVRYANLSTTSGDASKGAQVTTAAIVAMPLITFINVTSNSQTVYLNAYSSVAMTITNAGSTMQAIRIA